MRRSLGTAPDLSRVRADDVRRLAADVPDADIASRWDLLKELTLAVADCVLLGAWDERTARALATASRKLQSAAENPSGNGQVGSVWALAGLYRAISPADVLGSDPDEGGDRGAQMARLLTAEVGGPVPAVALAPALLAHSLAHGDLLRAGGSGDRPSATDAAATVLLAHVASARAAASTDFEAQAWKTLADVAERAVAGLPVQEPPVPARPATPVARSTVASPAAPRSSSSR